MVDGKASDKGIHQDELKVIHEIERAIKRKIPQVEKIKWVERIPNSCEFIKHKAGYVVENGHVIKLGLYNLRIQMLPSDIDQLSYLRELDIVNNQISELPKSLHSLTNLERIYAYKNRMTSLPEDIGELESLRELNFGSNKLTALPASIGSLTNLESLDLYENNLITLPVGLGQLQSLQRLNLDNNSLTNLPEDMENLKKLHELRVAGNKLRSIPDSIGKLANLQILNLLQNELTALPETLGNLKSLVSINVSYNRLESIPCSFTTLANLKKINLLKNKLTEIPECLKQVSDHVEIILDDHLLKHPPKSISDIEKKYIGDVEIVTGEITVTDPNNGINERALYYTRKGIWHAFLTYPDEEDGIISCTPFSSLILVHENFLERPFYPEDWEVDYARVDFLQLGVYDTIVFPEKQGIAGKLELQEAYSDFFEANKRAVSKYSYGFYEENGICMQVNASGRKFPAFHYENDRGFTVAIWVDMYDGETFEQFNYLDK